MIIGRQFVENQYEEKLYSTGNDELDEMLEKAFCEGYEYAQKEFSSIKQLIKSNNRFNQMWTSAHNNNLIPGKKKISSWSQLQKENIKRVIKKNPQGFNNIVSERASRGYQNIGRRNPNTAKKLTDADILSLTPFK